MITPEQAQELLDGDFESETHPEWVGVVQADFDSFSGAYIRATPGHEALYEAASDLAHTVANMHYEYAVQVKGGWWVGENDAGELVPTTDPMRALRHYHPDVASQLAAEAGKQLGHECCVARRLTTDWEVVE